MKKIFMAIALIATMGLTSCDWGKSNAEKDAEVVLEALEDAKDETVEVVEAAAEAVEDAKTE